METTVTKRRLGVAGLRKPKTSFSFFYSQTYCPYLFIIPSSFASAVSRGGTVRVGNATTAVTEVLKTEQLAAV